MFKTLYPLLGVLGGAARGYNYILNRGGGPWDPEEGGTYIQEAYNRRGYVHTSASGGRRRRGHEHERRVTGRVCSIETPSLRRSRPCPALPRRCAEGALPTGPWCTGRACGAAPTGPTGATGPALSPREAWPRPRAPPLRRTDLSESRTLPAPRCPRHEHWGRPRSPPRRAPAPRRRERPKSACPAGCRTGAAPRWTWRFRSKPGLMGEPAPSASQSPPFGARAAGRRPQAQYVFSERRRASLGPGERQPGPACRCGCPRAACPAAPAARKAPCTRPR